MPGKRKQNLVWYLGQRELGHPKRRRSVTGDEAQLLAEDKATLPVQNQSCELSGQCRSTFLMTFSPDGNKVASTHGDHTVRVTDIKTGRCTNILTGHPRTPWCIAFHPSSPDILASGCLGGEVRIWDLHGGGNEVWKSDQTVIASITFHPTDQVLVIATANEILFWDWTRPEPFARACTRSMYERVRWVKFDPWGHYLYTGIANAHQAQYEEQSEEVSYINDQNEENRNHLQERYRHLVDQITHYQHDRVQNHYPPVSGANSNSTPPPANVSTSQVGGMTFSGPHQVDIDIVEPRSPCQLEALQDARQYAEDVTRRSLQPAPSAFPYDMASASLGVAGHPDLEREVVRVRNDGASEAASTGASEEPPPPRSGSVAEHSQYLQGLGTNSLQQLLSQDMPCEHSSAPPTPTTHSLSVITSSHNNIFSTSSDPEYNRTVLNFPRLMPYGHLSVSITRHPPPTDAQPVVSECVPSPVSPPPGLLSISSTADLTSFTTTSSSSKSAGTAGVGQGPGWEDVTILGGGSQDNQGAAPMHTPSDSHLENPDIILRPEATSDESTRLSNRSMASILRSRLSHASSLPSSHTPINSTASHVTVLPEQPVISNSSQLASMLRSSSSSASRMSLLRSHLLAQPEGSQSSAASNHSATISSYTHGSRARLSTGFATAPSSAPPARPRHPAPPPPLEHTPCKRSKTSSKDHGQVWVIPSSAAGEPPTPRVVPSSSVAKSPHLRTLSSSDSSVSSRPWEKNDSAVLNPSSRATPSSARRELSRPRLVASSASGEPPRLRVIPSSATCSSAAAGGMAPSTSSSSSMRELNCPASTPAIPPLVPDYGPASSGHLSSLLAASSASHPVSRPGTSQLNVSSLLDSAPPQPSRSRPSLLQHLRNINASNSSSTIPPHSHSSSQRLPRSIPSSSSTTNSSSSSPWHSHLRRTLSCLSDQEGLEQRLAAHRATERPLLPPASSLFPPNFPLAHDENHNSTRADNSTGLLTTSAPTEMSSLLSPPVEHRIEHMEQLGADLATRGVQGTAHRCFRTRQGTARSRQHQRRQPMRAHLERLRRRYQPQPHEYPRVLPEGSDVSEASQLVDAERELGALQEEVSLQPGQAFEHYRAYMNRTAGGSHSQCPDTGRHDATWHRLERRHLHPHYSVSILDDTINRQNGFLQAAINRAIAGAFMGVGESAVASNIVNVTHRIQRWDFRQCTMPPVLDHDSNLVVTPCKLHNDASCDISANGELLAAFVPSHRGFPDDTILGVFSLLPDTLGQCIYTKSFGPNAISLSLSPLNNYVLVGLAAKRLVWVFTPKQMVAQVYKLKTPGAGEDSMEPICDLMHPCELDIRTHISVNSARWLPGVGEGMVYGTNKGDLHICRPGDDEKDSKSGSGAEGSQDSQHLRRNLMQMLGLSLPSTISTATQTVHRVRRSASTQTDNTERE